MKQRIHILLVTSFKPVSYSRTCLKISATEWSLADNDADAKGRIKKAPIAHAAIDNETNFGLDMTRERLREEKK